MSRRNRNMVGLTVLIVGLVAGLMYACRTTQSMSGPAAARVYVAPGAYDEFYAFMSGGFSGQVSVYGLPSGRMLKVIPVFSQNAENGYGYSEETKPMLMTTFGFIPWDDSHHTELSQTNGTPDGRWLFINGNNTPRVARIDLVDFETQEILQIPNSAGNHASPFITPNSEYVVASTRFSVPIPQRDAAIADFKNFSGTISFIKANEPGKMDVAFQIMMPGYDYDLSHSGKGKSNGWAFFTSYNTEQAHTLLEVNASKHDKDFVAAVNWKRAEACIQEGKFTKLSGEYYHNVVGPDRVARSEVKQGTKLITPKDCTGMVYFLSTPKSPHGVDVDPSGEYIVAGGKLATVIPVHSFDKMLKAIAGKQVETEIDGIPVLKYDATIAGEVKEPGLGPLHTEFDGKGNAYTSMFISSEVVKWQLGTWQVLDRIPTYYSIGHLMIPGGDSEKPWGKYLVALNKITKDRFLPTGPELAHAAQLIDISGDKMQLLLDFPTIGEPHYAQAIPADMLKDKQTKIFSLTENKDRNATLSEDKSRVERRGNVVHIYMTAIRSHFAPDNIEGIQAGDSVYFHVTNVEQDWDIPHGFAAMGNNNAELLLMPGETRTLSWVPKTPGVYPFYCTDFCSALHQEMQGYVRVSPRGSNVPLAWGTGGLNTSRPVATK